MNVAKLRAQLARHLLSTNDFEEALSYLCAKPAEDAIAIRRALMTAAIIAYARPFTQNETDLESEATSTVALKPHKVLSEDELVQHKRLIEMRHLAIAHSTSALRPVLHRHLQPPGYLAGHQVFDPLTQAIDRPLFASACEKLHSASIAAMSELNCHIGKAEDAA